MDERATTRLADFVAMTKATEPHISQVRECLEAIDTNGPVFAEETFSTPMQAALSQLKSISKMADEAQAARRALAVDLYDQGVPLADVLRVSGISRPTLFRWRKDDRQECAGL